MADEETTPNPFANLEEAKQIVAARRGSFNEIEKIRAYVTTYITGIYNGTDFQSEESVEKMITAVVKMVNAGQLQTANAVSAYLSQLMYFQTGTRVAVSAVDRAAIVDVRKVDPRVEYRRPVVTVYTALKKGKSFDKAKQMGLQRLIGMAMTDIQLSKMKQSDHILRKAKVTRYRRTLSGSENCPICEIASTQRYWVGDLSPIHSHCDCGVEPLPKGFPAGQVIDPEKLSDINTKVADFKASAGGTITMKDGTKRAATLKDLSFNRNSETGVLEIGWANRAHTAFKPDTSDMPDDDE